MQASELKKRESRAMIVAMAGNLFMGAAGVVAGISSNSNAIMMDGLFSLIGFTAALVGRRIGQRADAAPDRFRPMGYAAEESVFVTFRSLTLLGLIFFAVGAAVTNIMNYASGEVIAELNYGPMFIYFLLIGATSIGLWATHYFTWKSTGKVSDILRLEAKAAALDGLLTGATFVGLGAIYFFGDSFLAPIAPIGDSIVVIFLCAACLGQVWNELASGMSELLGVTAKPEYIAKAHRAVRGVLADQNGEMLDLSVVKNGRTFTVAVYYNPAEVISAEEVDALNLSMIAAVREVLPGADVVLCITQYPRAWPDEVLPNA